MVKIIGLLILILSIVLAPPAALAVISNNAVPGQPTYPIKRSLEKGIIALASLHPATKAYFQVDFTKRRFLEAQTLLLRNSVNAGSSLEELISQTNTASTDIVVVSDKKRKTQLVRDLVKNIDTYNKGLSEVNVSPVAQSNNQTGSNNTGGNSSTPVSSPTPNPTTSPTPRPTPAQSAAPSPRPEVDKCNSGAVLTPQEKQECVDKAKAELERIKYETCAKIGLNRAQCDALAQQSAVTAASPSPSATAAPAAVADAGAGRSLAMDRAQQNSLVAAGGGGAADPSPSPSAPIANADAPPPLAGTDPTPTPSTSSTSTRNAASEPVITQVNDGGSIQTSGSWSGEVPHEVGTYGREGLSLTANKTFKFSYSGSVSIVAAEVNKSTGQWDSGPFQKDVPFTVRSGDYVQLILQSAGNWSDLHLFQVQ